MAQSEVHPVQNVTLVYETEKRRDEIAQRFKVRLKLITVHRF